MAEPKKAPKKTPKRSEIETQYTWALEDLFADDAAWAAEHERMRALPEALAAYRGRLHDASQLYAYMQLNDEVSLAFEKLATYAMRRADEDTNNATYQELSSKVISLHVQYGAATAFDTPEILAISDEQFDALFDAEPGLFLYRRALDKIRRRKAHVLSDAEEKLLAASGEMANAPENISSLFSNADLKFPDAVDADGVAHPLTQASYIPLLQSADRVLRESAFTNLYTTFKSFKNTTAACLDAQVRQLMFYARARNYTNTLEASLDRTEVPVSVYHNLIEAVHQCMPAMYKYVRLRKKLLNVDTLHMYDLYTPMVPETDMEIPYDEAVRRVTAALAPLGDEYAAILREGFQNRWIDVYENEGKRSGAYSSGGSPHPYVLLNHKDTLDSMYTVAHEMGHALHTYYSVKNQPTVYADYVIFVAEVASTCNEVLLTRYLLEKTEDKRARAAIINHFLEQFRGTMFRQTMFAEFELQINQRVEEGNSLTADALCAMYYKLNQQYFGEDLEIDQAIEIEWARIPHFFYNYYVFQYATGFAAAVALANGILRDGAPAVERYIKFLSSGSIQDPISLLKIAGVDMTTDQPIRDALALFEQLIDEMDALCSAL